MTEFKIYETENVVGAGGEEDWRFWSRRPDGNSHVFIVPDAAAEFRIAEYGLDPEKVEDTLDILLHEGIMPDYAAPKNWMIDPARKAGLAVSTSKPGALAGGRLIGDEPPVTVWTAPVDAAREAHLLRVEHTKDLIARAVSKIPIDAFGDFAARYELDTRLVERAQGFAERMRSRVIAKQAPPQLSIRSFYAPTAISRADRFEEMFKMFGV